MGSQNDNGADDWVPTLLDVPDDLAASPEVRHVLQLIDGRSSVHQMVERAGLPAPTVRQILAQLIRNGAITVEDGGPREQSASPPEPVDAQVTVEPEPAEAEAPSTAAPAPETSEAVEDSEDEPAGQDEAGTAERTANYRRLFETELHKLPRDARAERAKTASGATLCAFCFDPDPMVIRSVLENLQVGLEHARLVADHHRNPVGLEALGRRAEFIRDGQVKRLLLRNVQSPDTLLGKVLNPLSLAQVYKVNMSRDNSERAKRHARTQLRQKFQHGAAEERVALIFTTEGRCLNLLIGLHLDQKTTALLCGRTYNSVLLIQSLARFAATPPSLIAHLFKQQVVRRSPPLRKMLLQHPNCPSQIKHS